MATSTAPRDWWEESDETLATAIQLLTDQADRLRKANRKGGRRHGR
jgi:hypothetical protein